MEVLGKENANYIFFSFLTSLSVLPSLPSLYFIFLIFLTYKGIRGSTCIIVYEMFSVMEIFLFVNFLMGFCLNFFLSAFIFLLGSSISFFTLFPNFLSYLHLPLHSFFLVFLCPPSFLFVSLYLLLNFLPSALCP